jgi:hypothetical protein
MNHDVTTRPQLVARLGMEQRQQLLAGLLSDAAQFATARLRLKPEYFNQPDEVALRTLWLVALRLTEQHGINFLFQERAAVRTILETETKAYFRQHPDECPLVFYDSLFGREPPGFFLWCYELCQAASFPPAYTARLLAAFLKERAVNDFWQQLARDASAGVITNVSQVLRTVAEREALVAGLDEDPVESGAPEGWLPAETKRRPTGIKWLDSFLRGGHAAPEVYGVIGATGSGKTTLGLQLCVSVAELEIVLAANAEMREMIGLDPSKPYAAGHCYYFHYEMSKDDIRKKLWSCAAMIDYDRIELMGKKGFELSSAAQLTAEEKAVLQLVAEQSKGAVKVEDFPGEKERLERAVKLLRTNFWQICCTGDGGNPERGKGFIPEIALILENERRKGRKVAVVVIDYAGACVDRHTSDKDEGYVALKQFGRRAEHEIGVPFDTPVWIMQQLAGALNERTAATKQHHSGASGCKEFANACWFAFNIGTTDEQSGCRYFTNTKSRRAGLGTPPILKVAGGFNRLVDVSSSFEFDRLGRVKPRVQVKSKPKAAPPAAGQPTTDQPTTDPAATPPPPVAETPAVNNITPKTNPHESLFKK